MRDIIVEFRYFEYEDEILRLRKDKIIGVVNLNKSGRDWTVIYTDHNKFRVMETEKEVMQILGWFY